jgi:hypothetical protein
VVAERCLPTFNSVLYKLSELVDEAQKNLYHSELVWHSGHRGPSGRETDVVRPCLSGHGISPPARLTDSIPPVR